MASKEAKEVFKTIYKGDTVGFKKVWKDGVKDKIVQKISDKKTDILSNINIPKKDKEETETKEEE